MVKRELSRPLSQYLTKMADVQIDNNPVSYLCEIIAVDEQANTLRVKVAVNNLEYDVPADQERFDFIYKSQRDKIGNQEDILLSIPPRKPN